MGRRSGLDFTGRLRELDLAENGWRAARLSGDILPDQLGLTPVAIAAIGTRRLESCRSAAMIATARAWPLPRSHRNACAPPDRGYVRQRSPRPGDSARAAPPAPSARIPATR